MSNKQNKTEWRKDSCNNYYIARLIQVNDYVKKIIWSKQSNWNESILHNIMYKKRENILFSSVDAAGWMMHCMNDNNYSVAHNPQTHGINGKTNGNSIN